MNLLASYIQSPPTREQLLLLAGIAIVLFFFRVIRRRYWRRQSLMAHSFLLKPLKTEPNLSQAPSVLNDSLSTTRNIPITACLLWVPQKGKETGVDRYLLFHKKYNFDECHRIAKYLSEVAGMKAQPYPLSEEMLPKNLHLENRWWWSRLPKIVEQDSLNGEGKRVRQPLNADWISKRASQGFKQIFKGPPEAELMGEMDPPTEFDGGQANALADAMERNLNEIYSREEDGRHGIVAICFTASKNNGAHAYAISNRRPAVKDFATNVLTEKEIEDSDLSRLPRSVGWLTWLLIFISGLAIIMLGGHWQYSFIGGTILAAALFDIIRTYTTPATFPHLRDIFNGRIIPVPKIRHPIAAWQPLAWASPTSHSSYGSTKYPADSLLTNHQDGIPIGKCLVNNSDIWIPWRTRGRGIIGFGDPDYGKSNQMRKIFLEDLKAKQRRDIQMSQVLLETKGEGAEWMRAHLLNEGIEHTYLSVVGTDHERLVFLDPNNPKYSSEIFAEAMRYAYEPGAIEYQALDIIKTALHIAAIMPLDTMKDEFKVEQQDVNRLLIAFWSTTGEKYSRPYNFGKILPTIPVIGDIFNSIIQQGDKGLREMAKVLGSPMTKFPPLLPANGFFKDEVNREGVTLSQIFNERRTVIINLGGEKEAPESQTQNSAELWSRIIAFLYWEAMKKNCIEDQSRGVRHGFYSDELHQLLGTKPHSQGEPPLLSLAVNGRSYGAMPVWFTQNTNQLYKTAADTVKNFGVRIYMHLTNLELARYAVEDLGEKYFTETDIQALDPGECAVKVDREEGNQCAPFSMKAEFLENPTVQSQEESELVV